MTEWNAKLLECIVAADDLKIAPLRDDGKTLGTPTWIWCVAVAGKLYARPWNGGASSWFKAAVSQKAGRILAAGDCHDLRFALADPALADAIDDAYRTKYTGKDYLPDMIGNGPGPTASGSIRPAERGRERHGLPHHGTG